MIFTIVRIASFSLKSIAISSIGTIVKENIIQNNQWNAGVYNAAISRRYLLALLYFCHSCNPVGIINEPDSCPVCRVLYQLQG